MKMNLFLYEVIFNGVEGRDDDADTIYLVRAPDFRAAIETACHSISREHYTKVKGPPIPDAPFERLVPDVVFEIGKDLAVRPDEAPILLRGPYVQCAYNYCWRRWERKMKDGVKTNEWEEKPYAEN